MNNAKELESGLRTIALSATCLCPLAFLTSMAAIEILSKSLAVAALGLISLEYRNVLKKFSIRLWWSVCVPLLGYVLITISEAFVLIEDPGSRWEVVKDQHWVLIFFAYAYILNKYFTYGWESYLTAYICLIVSLTLFVTGQFFFRLDSSQSRPRNLSIGRFF